MSRIVLDTNVVLSALLFTAGRLPWVRHAWQHHRLQPLACKETIRDLMRVLAYPKFQLTPHEQHDLLEAFLPYTDVVTLPAPWPSLPQCHDPKDQMFLVLAHTGKADILMTGDKDLLAMRDDFPELIMTPEECAARFHNG